MPPDITAAIITVVAALVGWAVHNSYRLGRLLTQMQLRQTVHGRRIKAIRRNDRQQDARLTRLERNRPDRPDAAFRL